MGRASRLAKSQFAGGGRLEFAIFEQSVENGKGADSFCHRYCSRNDTRVMPAANNKLGIAAARESTLCCFCPMEGVGFTAMRQMMGMPVVMPPKIPPALLPGGAHFAFLHAVGVVVLAAMQACPAKARAKLHALYGGDSKKQGGRCGFSMPSNMGSPTPAGTP